MGGSVRFPANAGDSRSGAARGQERHVSPLLVASDDGATVYLNGRRADADVGTNHEYQYWNRDVELDQLFLLLAGRNLLAVEVPQHQRQLGPVSRFAARGRETPLAAKSTAK